MSPQERVERSVAGRAVLSVAIAFILLTLVATNLPASQLRRDLAHVVKPARDVLGIDQAWGVFAPNPRRESWRLEAELEYADGSVGDWHPPTGHVLIADFRTYRWQKWAENARADGNSQLWSPLARWLASNYRHDGRPPVRVVLVRYWRPLPGPGEDPGPAHRWRSYPFYALNVRVVP